MGHHGGALRFVVDSRIADRTPVPPLGLEARMTQGAKPPTQGEDGEIRTTDGDIAFCALTAVCQRTDCTETVIVAVGGSYEGRHSLNDALPKGWGFEYISYEHAGRTHANEVLHCPTHLEDPTKASPGALDPPEEDEDE